jgi:hypothetical protein
LQIQTDEQARIVDFDATGLSSQRVNDGFLSLVEQRPDLWHWDWIVAIDQVAADATVGLVGELADGYAHMDQTDAVTVMVSPDSSLPFWARVLEFQHPGRRRLVVSSRIEALTLIETHRLART